MIKKPESKQEFLAVMVWVALIGAVVILFIDYQIKHSLLDLAKDVNIKLNKLGGWNEVVPDKRGTTSTASVPDSNDSGDDTGNGAWLEMAPLDRSAKTKAGPGRTANGRFAKSAPGDRDPGVPGNDTMGDRP